MDVLQETLTDCYLAHTSSKQIDGIGCDMILGDVYVESA